MFSYQSSLSLSQRQLIYNIISISLCQQFFYFLFFAFHFRKLFYTTMTASSCQLFFYIFCHFIFLRINTSIVLHSFTFNRHKVSTFQKAKKAETCAFQKCTVLSFLIQKRRKRDLNPRAAINDLLPFQGSPFGQLGYFSKMSVSYYTRNFPICLVLYYFFQPSSYIMIPN